MGEPQEKSRNFAPQMCATNTNIKPMFTVFNNPDNPAN